jgi:uncharacterized protein (DUF433 family)
VVVRYRQLGLSDAELLGAYPTITPADLDAAFAYYDSHRAEVDFDIAQQASED